MFQNLINFSIRNKFIIAFLLLAWISAGVWAMLQIPLDAVPDITNNQVQVVTVSPTLAPQEIELRITMPIEQSVSNIPGVVETRSISRYGLSVVTIVFEEGIPILDARQYVKEQLAIAEGEIPSELGTPELMPITTGLGEIYQYTLTVKPGYEKQYDAMQLRTIQDWIVKRRLAGTPGIIDISSFGGYLKQYEIAINPEQLQNYNISINDVFDALEKNNQNSGGSYIEKGPKAYYIRTEGQIESLEEIKNILVKNIAHQPVFIHQLGEVKFGSPKRYGAMTMDGKGEVVGGITLMLKGGSSSHAIANVHERIAEIKKSLPKGVVLEPYLDRSVLVGKTISTVSKNLIEGGLIVIFVLVLLLGNFRAGLIVASVIPLSMLFAFFMMYMFGVSANLMSLGAIDFGIVIDGAVIIVESILHVLHHRYNGKKLQNTEMDTIIGQSTAAIYRSAAFGVIIILVVFVPIMTLTGIEGKMFGPMAQTVSFAIIGAMILSLTYVPMVSALFLNKKISDKENFSDKLMNKLNSWYKPLLIRAIDYSKVVLSIALLSLGIAVFIFSRMGAEFIPTLEEGDLAMQVSIKPGSSLNESIRTTTLAEKILIENFPEVNHVVSKIGTSEIPTDPMAIEEADVMILLKDKDEWTSASNREELASKMKEKLAEIRWASFEFTQPIQLRFNELMTGSKADISVKIFGQDIQQLARYAEKAKTIIEKIEGAGDVKVEQTEGLTQYIIEFNDTLMATYGINDVELNRVIRTAFAGEKTGVIFDNEQRFDMVVRLDSISRNSIQLEKLNVTTAEGNIIPISYVARLVEKEGPMMISREDAKRRINIGVNVRNRDIASTVKDIQKELTAQLNLPAGYYITYGGQFENLQAASQRLMIAVPIALLLIFILLYLAFGSVKYALLIYSAVPLATVGGILALWIRQMPFSISAGVGFIALFGVAVLNGIVLISYINEQRKTALAPIRTIVIEGGVSRLRPVLMTAAVASLGFLPMALSSSAGAEVQKPLATVVIGGLITSTLLTLFVLPILYILTNQKISFRKMKKATVLLFLLSPAFLNAQRVSLNDLLEYAEKNHPLLISANLTIEKAEEQVKQNYQVSPLEILYTNGQINSEANDYMLEAYQNFGNLLQTVKNKKTALQKVETEVAIKNRLKEELIYEISSIYYSSVYYKEQIVIYQSQIDYYQELIEKKEKQLELGDISKIELSLFKNKYQLLKSELVKREVQLQQNIHVLKQLSYWQDTLVLLDEDLSYQTVSLKNENNLESVFLQPLLAEKEVILKTKAASNTYWFPQLGMGYFNQQLDLTQGFSGIKIGLSIPIIVQSDRSKQRELILEEKIIDQKISYEKNKLKEQIQASQTESKMLEEQVLAQKNMMTESYEMNRLNQETLEKGESNYYQFIMTLDIHLQNQLSYLETKHLLVQSQTKLNYLLK